MTPTFLWHVLICVVAAAVLFRFFLYVWAHAIEVKCVVVVVVMTPVIFATAFFLALRITRTGIGWTYQEYHKKLSAMKARGL